MGNPYPVRPGFRPPPPHQEIMAPPPMAPAGRYFGGGPHTPRGSMRPMNMGPPPRGPPARFMPPFNRPGLYLIMTLFRNFRQTTQKVKFKSCMILNREESEHYNLE